MRYVIKLIKSGAPWRWIPHDLPPWIIVYQQPRRWLEAGAFDARVADLRLLLRLVAGRSGQPRTAQRGAPGQPHTAIDAREWRTSRLRLAQAPQRLEGSCGGGYLGTPPGAARHPPNEQDRARVATLAFVDQGYTGPEPTAAAQAEGIELQVVKLPTARQGFVLLPKRWVVERSFAWASRFRRLARDNERLPTMLPGLHFAAFACLMLYQFIHTWSP